jgi:hypothetical protein
MRCQLEYLLIGLTLALGACGGSAGSAPAGGADAGVLDSGEPDTDGIPCPTGDRESGVCPPAAAELLDPDCPTAAGPEGVCAPAAREAATECPTEVDGDGLCAPDTLRFEDWDCPEAWTATTAPAGAGTPAFQVCTPPAVPESCPEGTWPRPGASACQAIGPDCPDGFASVEELRSAATGFDGALWYVAPDGQGDGSTEDAPLGSAVAALAGATAGDVVAVAGIWEDELTVDGVALVGACTQATRLGPVTVRNGLVTRASVRGVVVPLGSQAVVADALVSGASLAGINVRGTATLRDVAVVDTSPVEADGGWGLFVDGGTVTGTGLTFWRNANVGVRLVSGSAELADVVVADTLPVDVAPYRGRGIQVENNAALTGQNVVVVRNRNSAVFAAGPVRLRLEDAWIADTRGDLGSDTFGDGLTAYDAAGVVLVRAQLLRNRNSGITVSSPGTQVEVDQVVVADTQIGAVNDYGNGVYAEAGGAVFGRQLLVLRSHGSGVALHDADTMLEVEDLAVANTLPEASGSFGRGIGVQGGAFAVILRGLLADNSEAGVYASGTSTLRGMDLVVRGTVADPGTGEFGYGVNANDGARVYLDRCRLAENTGSGVLAGGDALVSLLDCQVVDTRAGQELAPTAITAQQGARIEVDRVALLRNVGVAVACLESGATIVGTDLLVADTISSDPNGRGGRAMEVSRRGEVTLDRVELRDNRELGLFVKDDGSAVVVRDLVIVGTKAGGDGLGGRALNVQAGASLEVARLRAQDNRDACVFVDGAGSLLALTDAALVGTNADESGAFGRAIAVQGAGELRMSRAFVGDNTEAGVFTTGTGTVLELTDVVIRDTRADGLGTFGRGLTVQDGATATLSRVLLAANHDVGVFVHGDGASVGAVDLEVRGTIPQVKDGNYGRGIGVQTGGTFTGERVRLVGNHHVSLVAVAPGTRVEVVDLWVSDTAAATCDTSPCAEMPGGSGVSALAAELELRRFSLQGSDLVGLQVGPDVSLNAVDGLITGNRIGVNIQDETLDLAASFDRVRVRDNETDRDLGDLPVPSVVETLDALTEAPE